MESYNKFINILNTHTRFADKLKELIINDNANVVTDKYDNIIINFNHHKNKQAKIMICSVMRPIELWVKKIEHNKIYFDKNIDYDIVLSDREVFKNSESAGITRSEYKENKITRQFVEAWNADKINIGDKLTIYISASCKGNKLYGSEIDAFLTTKICIDCINNLTNNVNDIYFTLCSSPEQAKILANEINPDYIILMDSAETLTDFESSQGCGIVYKDGCGVVNSFLREKITNTAKCNDISYQVYVGKHTPLLESLSIQGNGIFTGAIYVPVEHKKTSNQVVDCSDIYASTKLLINLLNCNLSILR